MTTATTRARGAVLRRRRREQQQPVTPAGPAPTATGSGSAGSGSAGLGFSRPGSAGSGSAGSGSAGSGSAGPGSSRPGSASTGSAGSESTGAGLTGPEVTVPVGAPAPVPVEASVLAGGAVSGVPIQEDVSLQVNALQAMCRQVFGFRLAMIALAAPAALLNAAPGLGARLVGAAVVVTFMGSYVLFRDWERFGPLLLRHPSLLAVDTLFGTLLLISAGPDTTLAYVSVCTPLLAGIVYGWRGAACFASLQSLILLLVHATLVREIGVSPAERLLLPGLCVVTGAMGSSLRHLMLRFGAATQALTSVKARLAGTEAVAAERARLAREMHDSVAKTLHGVALAADALAHSAGSPGMDPVIVRQHAELVARAARRAAAESRELLTDLRRESDPAQVVDLLPELAANARGFEGRTGLPVSYRVSGDRTTLPVPPAVARQLLTITSEAMENAHRHAAPSHVEVRAAVNGELLTLSVRDDGPGLPPGATLEQLRRSGHFGLVGMAERAAAVGARIRIGHGQDSRGTEVRLELPLTRPFGEEVV
ncbi:sensor histidine kinase [Streptomyces sp. NPDC051445]|uniref:sensor histidine kinase n=1 Tax=Streptomyces sp. NPDC051445 TaxID=3365653 RepID=UPI00379E5E12